MDEEYIYQKWLEILKPQKAFIDDIGDCYPDQRSLVIPFSNIFLKDPELADLLISDPSMVIRVGEAGIRDLLEPDKTAIINLRILGLHSTLNVRDIRASNLTNFVSIEGEIKKVTEVRPKLLEGMFSCTSCGFKQRVEQDPFHFSEPLECSKDDGGCGKRAASTTFKYIIKESLFIDGQKIQLAEKREDLRGTQQPQSIDCILEDDLCKDWTPGDIIKITGQVRAKQRKSGNQKSTTFIPYMFVNHIDDVNVEGYSVEYDKAEMEEFYEEHKENILGYLVDSFCPAIKGWNRVKLVMVLQHAGGTENGKVNRTEIHICLVGDPGTAKSTLGEWSSELVPGSVKVDLSGDNVTANGMTATAVKDEFGEGAWSIEAGAVVKAHKKFLFLDECHLGKKEIIGALHRPMENQEFSVSKAGIGRTFKSEFSAIFVMNPRAGRFMDQDYDKALVDLIDNTKFTAPWKDRICYYAVMMDKREEEKDREMFRHITKNKREGLQPEVDKEKMMQYFAYIRDNFHPIIPEVIEREIEDKFIEMRKNDGVYNRHLLSIFRFAEASAKVHCRHEVNSEDIDLAVKLVRESLQVMTAGYGHAIDMDAQLRGASKGKRQTFDIIKDEIRKLTLDSDVHGANENDLFQLFWNKGMKDIDKYVEELSGRNELSYFMRKDVKHWRVVE